LLGSPFAEATILILSLLPQSSLSRWHIEREPHVPLLTFLFCNARRTKSSRRFGSPKMNFDVKTMKKMHFMKII